MSMQSINRRTFMKASSLSAGALALGAVAAEAAPIPVPAAAEAPDGQVYASSLNFRERMHIIPLPKWSAQKVADGVPDSKLTRETTGLLREYSTPLLINHSHRAFFWANEFGRQTGKPYDAELLFICAAFHDLGLLKPFRSEDDRFEVDSANAVRQFLDHYGMPHTRIQTAWDAISLHTTPGIAAYNPIEVELLYNGVGLDVLGIGYEGLDPKVRDKVVAAFPRTDFHRQIAQAFYDGFGYKPRTTEGTCNEDICSHFTRNYKRSNFYEQIQNSAFPNS
jgi:hypothetical protein